MEIEIKVKSHEDFAMLFAFSVSYFYFDNALSILGEH